MKKVLVIGIVLLFALGILAGCSRPPATSEAPATPAVTDKPAETPAATETPGTEVKAGIDFVKAHSLHYSLKKEPAEGDVVEMKDLKAPEGIEIVVIKLDKNEAAPEDKEAEIIITKKGDDKVLAQKTFSAKDLKDKDVLVNLSQESEKFANGDYHMVIKEKDGKGLIEADFSIGAAGEKVEEKKDEEVKDETKPEDEKKEEVKEEVKEETK